MTEPTDPKVLAAPTGVNPNDNSANDGTGAGSSPPLASVHLIHPPTTLEEPWIRRFMPDGWLGDYLMWACKTTHTSPTFHLASGLAYAAVELALRGWRLEGTSYTYPALWFVLLAPSGEGKGTALRRIQSLMDLVEQYLPTRLKRPARAEGGKTVTCSGSMSAVLHIMENGLEITDEAGTRTPGLMLNEEFHTFFQMMYKSPEFHDVVLSLHDQVNVYQHYRAVQRGEDGAKENSDSNDPGRKGVVQLPCLSSLFVSSPAKLEGHLSSTHVQGGFAPRFMWLFRDKRRYWPQEPDRNVPEQRRVAQRIASWIEHLSVAPYENRVIHFPRNAGPVVERHARFSQALFEKYAGHPTAELYTPRLANQTQVLACVIAAIETLDEKPYREGHVYVREEHYALAENIATLAEETAGGLQAITAPRDWRAEQGLLQAIRAAGRRGLTSKEACGAHQRSLPTTIQALKAYADHGEVVSYHVPVPGRRGPTPVFWWHHEFAPDKDDAILDSQGRRILSWQLYERHLGKT